MGCDWHAKARKPTMLCVLKADTILAIRGNVKLLTELLDIGDD